MNGHSFWDRTFLLIVARRKKITNMSLLIYNQNPKTILFYFYLQCFEFNHGQEEVTEPKSKISLQNLRTWSFFVMSPRFLQLWQSFNNNSTWGNKASLSRHDACANESKSGLILQLDNHNAPTRTTTVNHTAYRKLYLRILRTMHFSQSQNSKTNRKELSIICQSTHARNEFRPSLEIFAPSKYPSIFPTTRSLVSFKISNSRISESLAKSLRIVFVVNFIKLLILHGRISIWWADNKNMWIYCFTENLQQRMLIIFLRWINQLHRRNLNRTDDLKCTR